jgi:hypothetical protein
MSYLKSPFDKWLEIPDDIGLHHQLFACACFLLEEGKSKEGTIKLLREICNDDVGRLVPDREIIGAVNGAWLKVTGQSAPGPIWPRLDSSFRAKVLQLYARKAQQLRAQVPAPRPAHDYLHQLYRETDLICLGRTASDFRTGVVVSIRKNHGNFLSMLQFINPSPMSAAAGLSAEGNWSAHTKSNTGPRVYGVVELDIGTVPEHATILTYLASKLPLVMMVFSGNKSFHGWFKTSHVTEDEVLEFYQLAVRLGADSKLHSPCQFTRLPMGTHGTTGRQQQVLYFNPANVYYK